MSENKSFLDFTADPVFQRREYLFERTGWALMALILVAAALGLFGKGMLSRAVLEKDHFRMEYDRYLHYGDLTALRVQIPPESAENGVVAVAFPNSYLHNFRIERIVPEPESSAHGDQTLFWFSTLDSGAPITVMFRLEPQKIGSMDGGIVVNGEKAYSFHQFVYP